VVAAACRSMIMMGGRSMLFIWVFWGFVVVRVWCISSSMGWGCSSILRSGGSALGVSRGVCVVLVA